MYSPGIVHMQPIERLMTGQAYKKELIIERKGIKKGTICELDQLTSSQLAFFAIYFQCHKSVIQPLDASLTCLAYLNKVPLE